MIELGELAAATVVFLFVGWSFVQGLIDARRIEVSERAREAELGHWRYQRRELLGRCVLVGALVLTYLRADLPLVWLSLAALQGLIAVHSIVMQVIGALAGREPEVEPWSEEELVSEVRARRVIVVVQALFLLLWAYSWRRLIPCCGPT